MTFKELTRTAVTLLTVAAAAACGGAAFQSGGADDGGGGVEGDGAESRDAAPDGNNSQADGCTPRMANGIVECSPGDTIAPSDGCLLDQLADGGTRYGGYFPLPIACAQCQETFTCDCVSRALSMSGGYPFGPCTPTEVSGTQDYPYVAACHVDSLGNMYVTCSAQ